MCLSVVFGSHPHAWSALGLYLLLVPAAALAVGSVVVNGVVCIVRLSRTAFFGLLLAGGGCLVLLAGYLSMQLVRWGTC